MFSEHVHETQIQSYTAMVHDFTFTITSVCLRGTWLKTQHISSFLHNSRVAFVCYLFFSTISGIIVVGGVGEGVVSFEQDKTRDCFTLRAVILPYYTVQVTYDHCRKATTTTICRWLKGLQECTVFSMTGLTYAHSCYLQSQWMETCDIILQTCGLGLGTFPSSLATSYCHQRVENKIWGNEILCRGLPSHWSLHSGRPQSHAPNH